MLRDFHQLVQAAQSVRPRLARKQRRPGHHRHRAQSIGKSNGLFQTPLDVVVKSQPADIELVASVGNLSKLLKLCKKTERRAARGPGVRRPKNVTISAYLCHALTRSPPHFSSCTALVGCCGLLPGPRRAVSALRKTRNQLLLKVDTDARHRHWFVRQSLCLWTACLKWLSPHLEHYRIFVAHAMAALLLKTARYRETSARIPSIRVSRASGYPTSNSNFPVFRSAATQTPYTVA
jgi:hypothetical protein